MSDSVSSKMPVSINGKTAIDVATDAARIAGAIIREHFSGTKDIQSKGNRNLVTDVDLEADKCIKDFLSQEFPAHSVLCEESGRKDNNSEYCWIVDPLDGTNNYAFGIPHVAVSIGLTLGDDILVGVIYDPLREELFQAENGAGSFLNGSPIRSAVKQKPKTMVIGTDLGYDDERSKEALSKIVSLWSPERLIRIMGSAALGLAYTACGRFDVYFPTAVYPWDIAAGLLLIREAGGEVTDWQGNPATALDTKLFCSGNATGHQKLRSAIIE